MKSEIYLLTLVLSLGMVHAIKDPTGKETLPGITSMLNGGYQQQFIAEKPMSKSSLASRKKPEVMQLALVKTGHKLQFKIITEEGEAHYAQAKNKVIRRKRGAPKTITEILTNNVKYWPYIIS